MVWQANHCPTPGSYQDHAATSPPALPACSGGGGGAVFYQTVQRAGVALPQEAILDFSVSGALTLSVTDDADNSRTVIVYGVPDADSFTDGTVNTLTQAFSGQKQFRNGIIVGAAGGGELNADRTIYFSSATGNTFIQRQIGSSGSILLIEAGNLVSGLNARLFVDADQGRITFDTINGSTVSRPDLVIANASGAYQTGQTTTINYTKPGGASGTLTFTSGLLTAFT